MAESYVPEGVFVICDKMTCGQPRKLLSSRAVSNVIYSTKSKPFLTIEDKKIDASFECVVKGSFWGGLQALAAGICIGALIVATGGGALVLAAAAVAVTAGVVSVGAGITALCSIAHACDATLESAWYPYSLSVRFNKSNALLNKSVLNCVQGGRINIIFDQQIAINAAKSISDSNLNAFYWQMGSQFTMGLITAVTTGGGIALVGAAIVAGPAYVVGEKLDIGNNAAENTIVGVGNYAASQVPGIALGGNAQKVTVQGLKDTAIFISAGLQSLRGYATYGIGVLLDDIGVQFEGAFRTIAGSRMFKSIDAKAVGKGLAGAIANIVIGTISDNYEDENKERARKDAIRFNLKDRRNGISVISKTEYL